MATIATFSDKVVGGTSAGEILFVELRQLPLGPAILTGQKLRCTSRPNSPQYAARCPACGREFPPPSTVVVAIQGRLAGRKAQTRLPCDCPCCSHALIFNSFFVDLDASDEAYEVSLRRGLAQYAQGPANNESVRGHLAALAVHLNQRGKSAEAAKFQGQYETLENRLRKECEVQLRNVTMGQRIEKLRGYEELIALLEKEGRTQEAEVLIKEASALRQKVAATEVQELDGLLDDGDGQDATELLVKLAKGSAEGFESRSFLRRLFQWATGAAVSDGFIRRPFPATHGPNSRSFGPAAERTQLS